MTTAYPGALDNLTNPTPSDTLNSATVPHASQHANLNDAMEAVQATLGTNPQGSSQTVKDRIVAAEGAIINLNLALAERVPGEAGSNAPGGALPNGYLWVDTSTNAVKVWNGTTFVDPSNAGSGGGLTWATVTGGTASDYTDPINGLMQDRRFAANGTLTVTAEGYVEYLVVGAGGGGCNGAGNGKGGNVQWGLTWLTVGSYPLVIGPRGASATNGGQPGSPTTGISRNAAGGAGGVNNVSTTYAGVTWHGTVYGKDGNANGTANAPANSGWGADGNSASALAGDGVVVISVKKP